MGYDSSNLISSRPNRYNYGVGGGRNAPVKNSGDVTISVTMKGATPAAHASAILKYFGVSKADEQAFKEKFGYDLRQFLTDSYTKSDDPKSHRDIGGGKYSVDIPIRGSLVSQIKEIKSRQQTAPTPVAAPNPNQVIAERNGYDQSAQTRNRLERNLPPAATPTVSPTPQPSPHPTPVATASSATAVRNVSQMDLGEKLKIVVGKAIERLGPEVGEKLKQLITPENIAIMVGTTAALIAVQGVPFVDVAVDAIILGVAVYSLGSEAIAVVGDLVNFATKTAGAKTEADLDSAAQSFAHATATVGVDALAALLIHKGVKSIKAGEIPPPNTKVVEMATPEGFRVKVRVEEVPDNVLLSKKAKTAKANSTNESGKVENIRPRKIERAESTVWATMETYRPGIKRSGTGRQTRYYTWDNLHGEIEVFDFRGNHIRVADPMTGETIKSKVEGRNIRGQL